MTVYWFSNLCIAGMLDLHSLSVRENFTTYFSVFLRFKWFLLVKGNKSENLSLFVHFSANLLAKICVSHLNSEY